MVQTICFKSKQQNTWFHLQSNPPYVQCTFPSFSTTLLCTAGRILLECLSAPSLQPSWWSPRLQNGSPWWPPWALGKEKSHTEQGQVNRDIIPARQCTSRPRTAGCSGHCKQVHWRGETATICPVKTLVSSRALSEANATRSLRRLAYWSSGPVAKTHSGRCLSHWRMWSTWIWLLTLTVLLSLASATSESSGAWFPGGTQKSTSHHQWWLF